MMRRVDLEPQGILTRCPSIRAASDDAAADRMIDDWNPELVSIDQGRVG